jgi:hypothetical protein
MICNKSGKSTAKNPSIKAECPFLLHFERKSFLTNQLRKKGVKVLNSNMKDNLVKQEGDVDMNDNETKPGEFNAKQFKKTLETKGRSMKRDPNNPFD